MPRIPAFVVKASIFVAAYSGMMYGIKSTGDVRRGASNHAISTQYEGTASLFTKEDDFTYHVRETTDGPLHRVKVEDTTSLDAPPAACTKLGSDTAYTIETTKDDKEDQTYIVCVLPNDTYKTVHPASKNKQKAPTP